MKNSNTNLFQVAIGFAASVLLYGCAAFQVAGDIQQGRVALLRGDPKAALPYFQRAAELDPNYITNYGPLQQSVWTYVGKTYYATGNLAEARKALERARSHYEGDQMARLYLGLTLARDGDRQRGLNDIETSLKELNGSLDRMEQYSPVGRFWDPGRYLRKEIQTQLAMISGKDIDWNQLTAGGEWLGKNFEEEIDRAKFHEWDEETRQGDGGPRD